MLSLLPEGWQFKVLALLLPPPGTCRHDFTVATKEFCDPLNTSLGATSGSWVWKTCLLSSIYSWAPMPPRKYYPQWPQQRTCSHWFLFNQYHFRILHKGYPLLSEDELSSGRTPLGEGIGSNLTDKVLIGDLCTKDSQDLYFDGIPCYFVVRNLKGDLHIYDSWLW